MNRICLVSCFLRLDGDLKAAWERLDSELHAHGHRLLLLTPDDPQKVSVPAIQVPFELRSFRSLVENGAASPKSLNADDQILMERDRLWRGSADYASAEAADGLNACRHFYNELIAAIQPVSGLVWGSSLPQSVVLRQVLEENNVRSFVLERGLLPGTLMLETHGNGADSDLINDPQLITKVLGDQDLSDMSHMASYFMASEREKTPQGSFEDEDAARARLGLAGKRVVAFFGQHDPASGLAPRDTAAQRLSPVYHSVSDALLALAEAIQDLDDAVLVFKPHPKDSTDYTLPTGSDKVRVLKDVNSRTLFALSDVIATMTSTVQFEALWQQKPLLLLAQSQLAGTGVAYEVKERAELASALSSALAREQLPQRLAHAQTFLAGVIRHFLFGINDEAPTGLHLSDLAKVLLDAGKERSDGPELETALAELADGGRHSAAGAQDFTSEDPHSRTTEGIDSEGLLSAVLITSAPIFVIGCPRSGTSVLSHSLGRHSQTWLGPESNFIAPLLTDAQRSYELGTRRGADHWLSGLNVSFEEYLLHLGIGINALYADRADGKRWIEQTPEYTLSLDNIGVAFPGAKFVNIVRDGREVVNSMINSGFPVAWARDFRLACETWVKFVQSALDYQRAHPDRVLNVSHQSLVADPESEFRRILGFLGLPWEDAVTEMFASGNRINSSFERQKKQGWQEAWAPAQRTQFNQICGPLQQQLGFDVNEVSMVSTAHHSQPQLAVGQARGFAAGAGQGAAVVMPTNSPGFTERAERAPVLAFGSLASYSDYQRHRAQSAADHQRRHTVERRLANGESSFTVQGHCYVCGHAAAFRVTCSKSDVSNAAPVPNWRESTVCPSCGFNNRIRAAVHLFEQTCKPSPADQVYICEQTSPLYRWLKAQYPNVVGSEYLGDVVPFGSVTAHGLRNESLMQLSFADNSLDHILSFDVFEHVADYQRALSECLRCLKPGGRLLFSVPFAPNSPINIVRARLRADGEIEHLLAPEYHFNPIQSQGSLCFYHFGWEMLDELRGLGFEDVAALHYWSPELGYLGGEQRCFIARKPA